MARLIALLRAARRSDSARSQGKYTRAGRLLEALVNFALAVVLLNLLYRSILGSPQARTSAAHQLWAVLAALLLFLPLGSRSSFQASVLSVQPISHRTVRLVQILSVWINNRGLAILLVSTLSTLIVLRLQSTGADLLFVVLTLGGAVLLSTALTLIFDPLQRSSTFQSRSKHQLVVHRWPIFRKNLHSFRRLLDPWVVLLLSTFISFTEISGRWIEAVGAALSVFSCAILCLPLFLLPYVLDTAAERTRQQLLPLSPMQILLRKEVAAVVLFFLGCLPMSLTVLVYASLQVRLVFAEELLTAVTGLLIAGVLLFRQPALSALPVTVGSLAGNQLPIAQFMLANMIVGTPMMLVLFLHMLHNPIHELSVGVLLVSMATIFGVSLRRIPHSQESRFAGAGRRL